MNNPRETRDGEDPFAVPRRLLGIVVVIGIFQAAALAAMLLLLRSVVDRMVAKPGELKQTIVELVGMGAVAVGYALLRWAEFAVGEQLGYELVQRLRMRMYAHLTRMTPRQLQHRSRGALLLRFTGDLTMLRTWISRGLTRGIVATLVISIGFGFMFYFNVWTAFVLFGMLLASAAVSLTWGARLRRLTISVRRKRSLLTSNVDEQLGAFVTVQAFGRTRGETHRLSRQNDSMTRTLIREARVRGVLRAVATGASWISLVAVLVVGAIEVAASHLTVGVVIASMFLVRQMTISMRNVALAHDYWQRSRVSKGKVRDFLSSSSRPLDTSAPPLRIRRGQIEFRNATVSGALENLSIFVEPNRLIAIVGPTGAGKSTLLASVARLAELDVGAVLIDGQDISKCRLDSLPRQIGVMAAHLPLMRGTLRRNLKYRLPNVSDVEVARQVNLWQLDERLATRESGLDAWLVEDAANLSHGERQLVGLARAWVGNPRILLLDEPTSALDESSKQLFRRIVTHHHGTVLMVTHDPADAVIADEVWHLDRGQIVGTCPGSEYRGEHESAVAVAWPP